MEGAGRRRGTGRVSLGDDAAPRYFIRISASGPSRFTVARGRLSVSPPMQGDVMGSRGHPRAVFEDGGATAVEYAILAACIAAVIVSAVALIGAATTANMSAPALLSAL